MHDRISRLQRRLATDPSAAAPLVSELQRAGMEVSERATLALAHQISGEFDRGIFDADHVMLLADLFGHNEPRTTLSDRCNRIIAQNEQLRLVEMNNLAAIGYNTEQTLEELREISNQARADWQRKKTIDPVPYWVHADVVIGLPDESWVGRYIPDAPLPFVDEDPEHNPENILSQRLTEIYQYNDDLKTAPWLFQPRGHARFITSLGSYLTFSYLVIQEEYLLRALQDSIRMIDHSTDHYMNKTYPRVVRLREQVNHEDLEALMQYGKKSQSYRDLPDWPRSYDSFWQQAGALAREVHSVIIDTGDGGSLLRQVSQWIDEGLSEKAIRNKVRNYNLQFANQ